MVDGLLRAGDCPPSGRLEIDVAGLRSGNSLYDAELLRRIDARRFPTAVGRARATARRAGRAPATGSRASSPSTG